MTEEQIKNTIRGFLQALASGDINRALSFIAENVDMTVWGGHSKAKLKYKNT